MVQYKHDFESTWEMTPTETPLTFHASYDIVYNKLKKWLSRFPLSNIDNSIYNDLFLFYLLAPKQYLDHRDPSHLFRLILSIHFTQKKLLRCSTFASHQRHLEVHCLPTELFFPFSSKPVLGCLVGFNLMDRYEVFDEENILLALKKYLPELNLVKESSYCHNSQFKNFKLFYLEIEKKNATPFTLVEQNLLRINLEKKVRNSIQTLSPTIFMGLNEEEIYKNILTLSHEIASLDALPQVHITLDQQRVKEIVFRITLVHVSPFHRFSLKERFFDCSFIPERSLTVRNLENTPIEAHIFTLCLNREPSLLRSDGSLDFYAARQRVVGLLKKAIGEFRDYNGGIIIQQQNLLQEFKKAFPDIVSQNSEQMETFFYAITPLEKQIVMSIEILSALFSNFLESHKEKLSSDSSYSFKMNSKGDHIFITVRSEGSSIKEVISDLLQEHNRELYDMAYNFIKTTDAHFFNCVLLKEQTREVERFTQSLQETLKRWHVKRKGQQVLRIGMEYSLVSLDPRIGGDQVSSDVLRSLFEGLTRFNQQGEVENAIAESIEISSDLKQYTFKLRYSLWNDGSTVSAYDFEYSWKKVLSPDFKTSFAYLFYIIKNAKEAKEGKLSLDDVGIHVIDDRTLRVELENPTPYFLQLTTYPIYSPVNRIVDKQSPQWPYQSEKNYPCNGPFQLKVNQHNHGCQLVKNPFYWDAGKVVLDQISLSTMSPLQAVQAFQKNEIDWVGNPFGAWHSFYVPNNKGDNVVSFPNSVVCWFIFNTQRPPFNHRKLRQAFSYAIQRAQVVANASLPLNPAYSLIIPRYRESRLLHFPNYDQEKARELFEEALQELKMTREDLAPLSLVFLEKGAREHAALSLKKQLKDCFGLDCELKPCSWNALFKKMTTSDFQLGLNQWVSWIDDPIETLSIFKSAKEAMNLPKWEHEGYSALLDLAKQEVNPFQRSSYLLRAEEIFYKEVPLIPLFYLPYQALVKKNFQPMYRAPCGPFNFSHCFFKGDV